MAADERTPISLDEICRIARDSQLESLRKQAAPGAERIMAKDIIMNTDEQRSKTASNVAAVVTAVEQEIATLDRAVELSGGIESKPDAKRRVCLKEQIEIYKAGQAGTVPNAWKKYELLADPEYAEFQRLSEKFKKVEDE